MYVITINKSDKFFIVICMNTPHSYLAAGVESKDKKPIILLDVGKAMIREERGRNMLSICYAMSKGDLNADILNEHKFVGGKNDGIERDVNYIAYGVTLHDYLKFLRKLKYLNPELKAYVPISETEYAINFELHSLYTRREIVADKSHELLAIKKGKSKLSFSHDCREASRQLASAVLPPKTSIDYSVPKAFYKSLACKNKILNGEFTQPLLILPQPPKAYTLKGGLRRKILEKLYHHLEEMLATSQNTEETREKFDCLVQLYRSLTRKKETQAGNHLRRCIKRWENKNAEIIDKHTGYNFFCRNTSTRNIVHEIECDAAKLPIQRRYF